MIFDIWNFPRDNGATDWNDSARLAGIMCLFQDEQATKIPLKEYVIVTSKKYVRHPIDDDYDFSRDQAVCLVAGLYKKGLYDLVQESYVNGKDIFSPSVHGHFRRCSGGKANWFQNQWLKLDIMWNAKFQPLSEPNQLICMIYVAGPEYIKLWTTHNKKWKESIRNYWSNWRNEPGIAELIIQELAYI